MNQNEILFIGGSWDGMRRYLPEKPIPLHFKIAIGCPIPATYPAQELNIREYKEENYTLEPIINDQKTWYVYKFDNLTTDDMIEKLIKRYPKKRQKKNGW